MKLETRLRNRRRAAVLRDARKKVASELDALRVRVGQNLEDYESVLAEALELLPDFSPVDRDELSALFDVPGIGADPVKLGPRVVAVIAAQFENFVAEWMGSDSPDLDHETTDEEAARYIAERDAVATALETSRVAARKLATRTEQTLGQKLDDTLAELEARREAAEGELLEKVDGGELEVTSERARKREAALWEEQRAQADALREAWAPLEELVFEGVEATVRGLTQVQLLFDQATAAIEDAYPEFVPPKKPKPIRVRKITAPPPLPTKRDGGGSPSFVVDDAHRVTEPMSPYDTEEFARQRHETGEEAVVVVPDEELELEPPGSAAASMTMDVTIPAEILAADEVRGAGVSMTMELDIADEIVDEVPAPVPTRAAAPRPDIAFDVLVRRSYSGWLAVRSDELLLVLGPPAICNAVLGLAAVGHQVGIVETNVFREWDPALPLFLGLGALMLLLPALLRWRVRWDTDWIPSVVRWQHHRESVMCQVGQETLTLRDVAISWDAADCGVGRSASHLFATVSDGRQALCFVTDSSNAAHYDWPHGAVPRDAWNVSEDAFHEIVARC